MQRSLEHWGRVATVVVGRVAEKYRHEGLLGLARAVVGRLTGATRAHPIADALARLAVQGRISIVQVGAHVGPSTNNPLHHFLCERAGRGLRAVLIEPDKEHFARLRENYGELAGVHFENVAIADAAEERDFYRLGVDPQAHGYPDWLAQLSSLRADRMTELWDRYEADERLKEFYLKHRVVDRVRCVTLMALVEQYEMLDLDLLQIDAEGSDYEILKSLDFRRIRPRFINYERILLSKDDDRACRAMLRSQGYQLRDHHQDTFCIRRR